MNPAQTPRQVAKGTQASVAAKSELEREVCHSCLPPSISDGPKGKGEERREGAETRVRAEEEQRSGN